MLVRMTNTATWKSSASSPGGPGRVGAAGRVAACLPHSFAWSGNLYIVPADHVTPLDAKAADVLKFIVSGGVAKEANR